MDADVPFLDRLWCFLKDYMYISTLMSPILSTTGSLFILIKFSCLYLFRTSVSFGDSLRILLTSDFSPIIPSQFTMLLEDFKNQ